MRILVQMNGIRFQKVNPVKLRLFLRVVNRGFPQKKVADEGDGRLRRFPCREWTRDAGPRQL